MSKSKLVYLVDIWFPEPEPGEFHSVCITEDLENAKMMLAGKIGLITPVEIEEVNPDGIARAAREYVKKEILEGKAKEAPVPDIPDLNNDLTTALDRLYPKEA